MAIVSEAFHGSIDRKEQARQGQRTELHDPGSETYEGNLNTATCAACFPQWQGASREPIEIPATAIASLLTPA